MPLSSWRVGQRTASQRPGTSFSVNASSAAAFSSALSTSRARRRAARPSGSSSSGGTPSGRARGRRSASRSGTAARRRRASAARGWRPSRGCSTSSPTRACSVGIDVRLAVVDEAEVADQRLVEDRRRSSRGRSRRAWGGGGRVSAGDGAWRVICSVTVGDCAGTANVPSPGGGARRTREIAASVEAAVAAGALAPGARLPSVRGARRLARREPDDGRRRARRAAPPRGRDLAPALRPAGGRPAAARVRPRAPAGARGRPRRRRPATRTRALLPDVLQALRGLDGPPRLYGAPRRRARAARRRRARPARRRPRRHAPVRRQRRAGRHRARARRPPPAGDALAVEDPGFPGVLDLVRAVRPAPDPGRRSTTAGCAPTALAARSARGARAVILTPRGQNPTGAALDAAPRARAARGARPRARRAGDRGRPPRPGRRRAARAR